MHKNKVCFGEASDAELNIEETSVITYSKLSDPNGWSLKSVFGNLSENKITN